MKKLFVILVSVLCICSQAYAQETAESKSEEVTYSEIRKLIDNGRVERGVVTNDGWWVSVYTAEGVRFYAEVTPQTPIADHLYAAGIPVRIEHRQEEEGMPLGVQLFLNIFPLLIFIVFFSGIIFFMRKNNGGYYGRAEKINVEFLDRLEKLLTERGKNNG